jgi:hypothetical protein
MPQTKISLKEAILGTGIRLRAKIKAVSVQLRAEFKNEAVRTMLVLSIGQIVAMKLIK